MSTVWNHTFLIQKSKDGNMAEKAGASHVGGFEFSDYEVSLASVLRVKAGAIVDQDVVRQECMLMSSKPSRRFQAIWTLSFYFTLFFNSHRSSLSGRSSYKFIHVTSKPMIISKRLNI